MSKSRDDCFKNSLQSGHESDRSGYSTISEDSNDGNNTTPPLSDDDDSFASAKSHQEEESPVRKVDKPKHPKQASVNHREPVVSSY
jgi:hypothetical protein